MKKIFICLSIVIASLFTVNATTHNNTTESNHYTQQVSQSFVGEYCFCTKDKCNEQWWNVYRVSNGYCVSVPLNRDGKTYNKYYDLIPCNELGYTHYASVGGTRWYVRI